MFVVLLVIVNGPIIDMLTPGCEVYKSNVINEFSVHSKLTVNFCANTVKQSKKLTFYLQFQQAFGAVFLFHIE